MVANVSGLPPKESVVLEVFRRLAIVGLEPPTLATLAQQTGLKLPTVHLACERLRDRGLLEQGVQSKVSYTLVEDLSVTEKLAQPA